MKRLDNALKKELHQKLKKKLNDTSKKKKIIYDFETTLNTALEKLKKTKEIYEGRTSLSIYVDNIEEKIENIGKEKIARIELYRICSEISEIKQDIYEALKQIDDYLKDIKDSTNCGEINTMIQNLLKDLDKKKAEIWSNKNSYTSL